MGAHGVANYLEQILYACFELKDTKVLFLLIGQGMEKKRLVAKAQELDLTNIRFLDPVPKSEVFKYILASDIGASVLKKVDAFKTVYSNKTFDYFSCKVPVLMAIDGVSRELVESANAGVYVEPENPSDLAKKVRYYLDNPNILEVQGINGYEYAKKNFDRVVLANEYISQIKRSINYV